MNILDKIFSVLNDTSIKLGFIPDSPDSISALMEYAGEPPTHFFGDIDIIQNIQLITRGENSYNKISEYAKRLNGYNDSEISIIQISSILDIGRDIKQRQEYTVNFKIYRR